jgi:hypothetical protein
MLMPMRTIWFMAAVLGAALLTGGCAKQTPSAADDGVLAGSGAMLHVEPGKFAVAFDESRDVLRDLGFLLDRVDGQLGVITTQPKGTGGILTPWDQEQSGIDDRLEDAVHKHRRVVRIEFAPEGAEPGSADIHDLRTEPRPMDARIAVTVYRLHQPGWRLNSQAILESSYSQDPQLNERGMGLYSVAIRQDDDLARRIVQEVRERMARQAAAR